MVVVSCRIELHLPLAQSLKDKRQIIKSVLAKIKNKVNCSIIELEFHDLWQRSALGIAMVGLKQAALEHNLTVIEDLLATVADLEVVNIEYEYF